MLLFAKLIGLCFIGMGIFLLLKPETCRQMIAFWRQGNRIYIAGIIRLVLGSYFLLVASQCRWIVMMIAIGILLVAGGISIFALGFERIQKILGWFERQKEFFYRVAAAIVLAFGALLLYSI